MYRKALRELAKWKESRNRKPLLIRGARQVGKTWLMREFGRTHFAKTAYVNFDDNPQMEALFQGDLGISRIISALKLETGVNISPEDTLLVFDEVQEVPRALTSLKYLSENAPEYAVVAAGSLLGVALHPGTSFPVGKVAFIDLYPMTFSEFLSATDRERYAGLLGCEAPDMQMITVFKDKFTEALKEYMYIGGMPEAVSAFSETGDYDEARQVQNRILSAYENDFSKHAPNEAVPRIRMLWNSIPPQLAKENRKFVYGHICKGARAREYELAMQWLIDCGLMYKVNRVNKPNMPLLAYTDISAFKLFMHDVGLMSAKSNLDVKSLLDGNRVFEEFKGALTEQYVMQQLLAECDITPQYWAAERATAEVDFVFQHGSGIFPMEVKAGESLKAKSLRQYYLKYKPQVALRSSMSDYRRESWMINLPLYAISCLKQVLEMN